MGVHPPKTPYQGLLVAGILSTGNLRVELVQNLKTITEIVLHGGSTGLIVEHVEHLPKVHGRSIGSPVSDKPEHHTVRVILQLDILVHPHLP
ncbi:AC5 [Tomato leaf curl purple vein virus]|uniref:AC5 n=1 Tax=Tomato leaf curl purple vein virus TaxID=2021667 RepID=A0A223HF69_9GEMI|nr:AC5 [Tomato leaf curl purple vein virus]AST47734.1 AC5 [Tomato leaf curl purple vein virus]